MAKHREQIRARELRAAGYSLAAIARELGVAKSSVSVWVRDVDRDRWPAGAQVRPVGRRLLVWRSSVVRRCARCRYTLPLELFGRTRSGHQGWCRPCFREYARMRGRAHYEQVRSSKIRRRDLTRAWVMEFLGSHPCVDCGISDVIVLDFDHVADKQCDISRMVADGIKLERVQAEAARCEVVCASCHRHRTARRSNWLRASPTWRQELAGQHGPHARNRLFTYNALVASGCVDCGVADLVALDFDHIGPKRKTISDLVRGGYSLATIASEIARCEVRCANCHRRKTGERAQHYRSVASSRPVT